ncbi:MAG: hypothetical protein LUQ11_14820 [Methylococcaceae bacterium]|nr:hypothetical protein [Methylococcaceae bacterium]
MSTIPASFRLNAGSEAWQPERVLLFSGHMIDGPGRTSQRFPADKEDIAAKQIAATLDKLQAGPNDLGLTQGACGGDILFAEACLQRGVKLRLLQPFEESTFIENSVAPANADWLNRYLIITRGLESPPLAVPQEMAGLPAEMNAYERCNLWLLASAQAYGPEKLTFICLWDGGGGDGPGGTAHMVEEVKKHNGRVIWLDTRELW